MELCYEEYSDDEQIRYRIYKNNGFYKILLERYHDEYDCMGYIEPAGFSEVRDNMVHHVGTIEEGISIGRELLKSLI